MKRIRITYRDRTRSISVCDFTPESAIRATLHRYFSIREPLDSLFFYLPDSRVFVFPPRIPNDLHLFLDVQQFNCSPSLTHADKTGEIGEESAEFPKKRPDISTLPRFLPPLYLNTSNRPPTQELRPPEVVDRPSSPAGDRPSCAKDQGHRQVGVKSRADNSSFKRVDENGQHDRDNCFSKTLLKDPIDEIKKSTPDHSGVLAISDGTEGDHYNRELDIKAGVICIYMYIYIYDRMFDKERTMDKQKFVEVSAEMGKQKKIRGEGHGRRKWSKLCDLHEFSKKLDAAAALIIAVFILDSTSVATIS
jgi:hypothetical protein